MRPLIYFASSGAQTIRVQTREDSLSIDQIVLSHTTYVNSSPGALKSDTRILTPTNSARVSRERLQARGLRPGRHCALPFVK